MTWVEDLCREAKAGGIDWTGRGLHLAVLAQPWLDALLDGHKSIESRFAAVRCAPWQMVHEGDVVLCKGTGGRGIVGAFDVGSVRYMARPTLRDLLPLRHELCVDRPWLEERLITARYCSLIGVSKPRRWPTERPCGKRDRRGWVPLELAPPAAFA